MEALTINKIAWFEKQLQHKAEVENLKFLYEDDAYLLSMAHPFVLDCYEEGNAESSPVSVADRRYAKVEQGKRYRLQVNDRVLLFKVLTRKIWFFESLEALRTDLKAGDKTVK